jgi:two-component system sensor histidine kinase KdpD
MFFSLSHGDQYPSGTGLGLAICQGILGAHGGEAKVLRSRSGETVIRLSLPLPETPFTALEPQ